MCCYVEKLTPEQPMKTRNYEVRQYQRFTSVAAEYKQGRKKSNESTAKMRPKEVQYR